MPSSGFSSAAGLAADWLPGDCASAGITANKAEKAAKAPSLIMILLPSRADSLPQAEEGSFSQ
jgi:hypothetical protein